jgi:hypothetical protein
LEAAKWIAIAAFCIVALYALLALILVLTGVWGGE